MSHKSRDSLIAISASDLVNWTGDNDENCIANPYLVSALNLLCIYINPTDLYTQFYDNPQSGKGDVYLYQNHCEIPSYFCIDMYRELTDQQDIIQLAIRATENPAQVKVALRSFFDTVENQFHYEESNSSLKVSQLIDIHSYPKTIKESGYKQNIHEIKNC